MNQRDAEISRLLQEAIAAFKKVAAIFEQMEIDAADRYAARAGR